MKYNFKSKDIEWLKVMSDTYEQRNIDKTELSNGLTVSTIAIPDQPFETVIFTEDNAYIIEHYKTKIEAEDGHNKRVVDFSLSPKTLESIQEDGTVKTIEIRYNKRCTSD